jgi:hypothetical protein
MKKSTKRIGLSHADVSKALMKFKQSGGLIKRLPDQVVPKSVMVGGKFSVYETVLEGAGSASASPSLEAVAE